MTGNVPPLPLLPLPLLPVGKEEHHHHPFRRRPRLKRHQMHSTTTILLQCQTILQQAILVVHSLMDEGVSIKMDHLADHSHTCLLRDYHPP